MTRDERYNEIQKARSTFMNALAIGSVIAGGLNAVGDGRWGAAVAFTLIGLVLHRGAVWFLQNMRTSDDDR